MASSARHSLHRGHVQPRHQLQEKQVSCDRPYPVLNFYYFRTLSEFWHWFVANIPGDSVDDGEVIFELLFPLVLPEGDGDHRYGFFVFEQPGQLNYQEEGGPTDSCSPQMSNGRGPFKSTKNFMKKYGLDLTAATFIILDSNEASMEVRKIFEYPKIFHRLSKYILDCV